MWKVSLAAALRFAISPVEALPMQGSGDPRAQP